MQPYEEETFNRIVENELDIEQKMTRIYKHKNFWRSPAAFILIYMTIVLGVIVLVLNSRYV